MNPHNNAALMTRSLQMRNSLLTAATNQSASSPSALLASQAAAAAMFNHHQSASLFAAANIKSNSAVTGNISTCVILFTESTLSFNLELSAGYTPTRNRELILFCHFWLWNCEKKSILL